MGFALWVDTQSTLAWAEGTHEYRPMGAAVIAVTDQFRRRDFSQVRRRPKELDSDFVGFFGSLEDLNARLRTETGWKRRSTPGHLR
jgi:hypothetical protein